MVFHRNWKTRRPSLEEKLILELDEGLLLIMKLVISLFLLTLIPPLFRKYTQRYLDEWDRNQASNAERQIAKDYYENSKHLSNDILVT